MTEARVLLLSLHPRFADAILAGTKTIDLRRRPVRALPGTPVVLYASGSVKAVVGVARLRAAYVVESERAWNDHHHALGLGRIEFEAYLNGRPAHLLVLDSVQRLSVPIPLQRLQEETSFRPPQSFRYLAPSDPARVHELVSCSPDLL